MMDYKEWIQQEAERIALYEYNVDFYSINDDFQMMIWQTAEENYWNRMAAMSDAYADMILEREMEEKHDKERV